HRLREGFLAVEQRNVFPTVNKIRYSTGSNPLRQSFITSLPFLLFFISPKPRRRTFQYQSFKAFRKIAGISKCGASAHRIADKRQSLQTQLGEQRIQVFHLPLHSIMLDLFRTIRFAVANQVDQNDFHIVPSFNDRLPAFCAAGKAMQKDNRFLLVGIDYLHMVTYSINIQFHCVASSALKRLHNLRCVTTLCCRSVNTSMIFTALFFGWSNASANCSAVSTAAYCASYIFAASLKVSPVGVPNKSSK